MANSTEGPQVILATHYATRQPVRLAYSNGAAIELEPAESAPANIWIAPALFDLQVNGYGGVDFQGDDLSIDELLSATRQLKSAGCTQIMLTLVTDEWMRLTTRLKRIKRMRDDSPELTAAIAGWHIEGPFLSPKPGFHGAHDPALMWNPSPTHIDDLRKITGTDPLLITLAPERTGAIESIARAANLGIRVSLGHTDASGDILKQAVLAGATAFTHLGNGCPQQLDRHDNVLWRVFETPGLTAGVIPDTIHVSPALFRIMHRQFAKENLYYTTDAVAPAGAPPGEYKVGRLRVNVGADLIVRQPGRTNFAGSALRPIDGVLNAARMLERPWQDLWDHHTTIPRRLCGLENRFLAPGDDATFCLLQTSDDGQIQSGKVYTRGEARDLECC